MAINPNKPVQPAASHTPTEGKQTPPPSVDGKPQPPGPAAQKRDEVEAAKNAQGKAEASVSLWDEAVEWGKETWHSLGEAADKMGEAIQRKYSNPPEKPLIDKLQKALDHAGDKIEEAVDDLQDGRTGRDVGKTIKRTVRDNFTERTPLEKARDAIQDKVEDLRDGISDVVDDVKDGRAGKKLRKALGE